MLLAAYLMKKQGIKTKELDFFEEHPEYLDEIERINRSRHFDKEAKDRMLDDLYNEIVKLGFKIDGLESESLKDIQRKKVLSK